jgi:hypothetical protein
MVPASRFTTLQKAIENWNTCQNEESRITIHDKKLSKAAGFGERLLAFYNEQSGWRFEDLGSFPFYLFAHSIRFLHLGYSETRLGAVQKEELRKIGLVGELTFSEKLVKEKEDKRRREDAQFVEKVDPPGKARYDSVQECIQKTKKLLAKKGNCDLETFAALERYLLALVSTSAYSLYDYMKARTHFASLSVCSPEYYNTEPPSYDFFGLKVASIDKEFAEARNDFESKLRSKETRKSLIEYLDACLDCLSQDKINDLADNVADEILCENWGRYSNTTFTLVHLFSKHSNRPSEKQLFAAAACNDLHMLHRCRRSLPFFAFRDKAQNGMTAFHVAVYFNHYDFAKKFLEILQEKSYVDIISDETESRFKHQPKTSLLERAQSAQMVELLLTSGIKLNFDLILTHYIKKWRQSGDPYRDELWKMIELVATKKPELIDVRESNGKSLLENSYDHWVQGTEFDEKCFRLFIKLRPDTLTENIQISMKDRAVINQDDRFLEFLSEDTRQEIETIRNGRIKTLSFQTLEAQCKTTTAILKRELKQWNLAPIWISLEEAYKAYCLHRDIKDFLKTHSKEVTEKFRKAHRDFLDVYHTLTRRHPLLNAMHQVSRELRKPNSKGAEITSQRAVKLISLIGPEVHRQSVEKIGAIWKKESRSMRLKVAEAHGFLKKLPFGKMRITLSHGTKSPSFFAALQTTKKLMPHGELKKAGLVCFSGERTGSKDGQNVKGISAMPAEESWGQHGAHLATANATRLLIAKGYATRDKQTIQSGSRYAPTYEERSIFFEQEHEYEHLKDGVQKIKDSEKIDWDDFSDSIRRLKSTDPQFLKKTKGMLKDLKKIASKASSFKKEKLDPCIRDWEKPPEVLLKLGKTYPILLASSTYEVFKEMRHSRAGYYYKGEEVVIEHSLNFGGHIQLVGTTEEGLQEVEAAMEAAKVRNMHAVPMETLQLIELQQLIEQDEDERKVTLTSDHLPLIREYANGLLKGKEALPLLDKALKGVSDEGFEETLKKAFSHQASKHKNKKALLTTFDEIMTWVKDITSLAQNAHRYLIPYYATPYAQDPYFLNEQNEEVRIPRSAFYGKEFHSNHTEYMEAIQKGEALARFSHGAMHAARVALFAMVLYSIYLQSGKKMKASVYALIMAAFAHDIGRRDEGRDHWDRATGNLFNAIMRDELPEETLKLLVEALIHKDPADAQFLSFENEIIHDADCLDFSRVLDNVKNFRRNELHFYAFNTIPQKERDGLINEAMEFTRRTESLGLKMYLEHNSQNYLGDVATIFKHLHQKEKCFPNLMKHLKPFLAVLCVQDLPQEVIDRLAL